jgi:hypothetical protein
MYSPIVARGMAQVFQRAPGSQPGASLAWHPQCRRGGVSRSRRVPRCASAAIGELPGRPGRRIPSKITIDKSGANTAAIESYNADHDAKIETRQVKYLNNIVEQDHRAIKRMTRPMLGFKSFWSAAITIAGIEIMHMIRKGQMRSRGMLRSADQFYALAK